MKRESIILIGFMGSGKTTVGMRLSYKIRRPVEDLDKMIERREACTISELFATKGEEYFREKETELLRELVRKKRQGILSAGGGTPMRQQNRDLLKQLGTVVYLRVRPETVYGRLKWDKSRPLLQCKDPLSRIQELMESRAGAYESCADIIVDADELDLDEIQNRILRRLTK